MMHILLLVRCVALPPTVGGGLAHGGGALFGGLPPTPTHLLIFLAGCITHDFLDIRDSPYKLTCIESRKMFLRNWNNW